MARLSVLILSLAALFFFTGCAAKPDPTKMLVDRVEVALLLGDAKAAYAVHAVQVRADCAASRMSEAECAGWRVTGEWLVSTYAVVKAALLAPPPPDAPQTFDMATFGKFFELALKLGSKALIP